MFPTTDGPVRCRSIQQVSLSVLNVQHVDMEKKVGPLPIYSLDSGLLLRINRLSFCMHLIARQDLSPHKPTLICDETMRPAFP